MYIVDKPGAVQTTLIGSAHHRRVAQGRDPRRDVNSVSGGFSSRMTANLRESKGYTYCPPQVSNCYRDAVWARTDVTTAVTARPQGIFLRSTGFRLGFPSEAELEPAEELHARHLLSCATPTARASS